MYEQFKSRAEAVGAELHRCGSRGEALAFIRSFLEQAGADKASPFSAVWAPGRFLKSMDSSTLAVEIPGLSFNVTRESSAAALIGITDMDWAAADTGSLVADQSAVEQRLASTLPAIHIAIIATDRILPDKVAVFSMINPRESRYIAFITGPSRTADIERVLTIGVHGPKRLVIVVVDEMEGAAP